MKKKWMKGISESLVYLNFGFWIGIGVGIGFVLIMGIYSLY